MRLMFALSLLFVLLDAPLPFDEDHGIDYPCAVCTLVEKIDG